MTDQARREVLAQVAHPLQEGQPPSNSALDLAMAMVGDRWTLLVVDALLEGPLRFKDLGEAVPGLAPNVLSARLRRLEQKGWSSLSPIRSGRCATSTG